MNILDIDAGNTRLKWRLLQNGETLGQGAIANAPAEQLVSELAKALEGVVATRDSISFLGCRLSSVRSPEAIEALQRCISKKFGVEPVQPVPEETVKGLVVKTVDPKRLGDDRWLAMLGAVTLYPGRPIIVVDSGTALTLDCINAQGEFSGGLICPGLKTMLKGMASSADRLVLPERPDYQRGVAAKSLQAVQNGTLTMALSLIESEFRRIPGHDVKLILCGGDASLLAKNLEVPATIASDLVFDGLAAALPLQDKDGISE